jgi:hypothetical protein
VAFPGTYNFSYYKGDTLEFTVYPKDASGAVFFLEDFVNDNSPAFTISTTRGVQGLEDQVSCFAKISDDFTHIVCTIKPEDGERLNAGTQYVYDVEINRGSEPYDIVYTILTGNISVTDQVTMPMSPEYDEMS